MEILILRTLTSTDQVAFERAFSLFPRESDFEFVPGNFYKSVDDFGNMLARLTDYQNGFNLSPGHVPSTMLFAFNNDGEIVGRVSIRHSLNDFLLKVGGHVGYGVVPRFRRLGYAAEMLRLSLPYCKKHLSLDKILVTCSDDNPGSIRTIEKNGGVLEDIIRGDKTPVGKRRYWIHLP